MLMIQKVEGAVVVVVRVESILPQVPFLPGCPPFSSLPPSPPPGVSAIGRAAFAAPALPVISAWVEIYGSPFEDFSLIITFIIILEIKS